jgi:hypothetical protein
MSQTARWINSQRDSEDGVVLRAIVQTIFLTCQFMSGTFPMAVKSVNTGAQVFLNGGLCVAGQTHPRQIHIIPMQGISLNEA